MNSTIWIPDPRSEPRRVRHVGTVLLSGRSRTGRALMAAMGVLLLAVLLQGGALLWLLLSARVPPGGLQPTGAPPALPVAALVSAPVPGPAPVAAQPVRPQSRPVAVTPARSPVSAPAGPVEPVAASARPVSVGWCGHCGVVESVVAVQRQGRVDGIGNSEIGIGAIGGAVLGGLLGNQVGAGSGKTWATVLGAAGGAYAGHEIEKRTRRITMHQHHVRMDDGRVRVIEQPAALAVGTRVTVDGDQIRVMMVPRVTPPAIQNPGQPGRPLLQS